MSSSTIPLTIMIVMIVIIIIIIIIIITVVVIDRYTMSKVMEAIDVEGGLETVVVVVAVVMREEVLLC